MNEQHAARVAEITAVMADLWAAPKRVLVRAPPWLRNFCHDGSHPVTAIIQASEYIGRIARPPFTHTPDEWMWHDMSEDARMLFLRNYLGLK